MIRKHATRAAKLALVVLFLGGAPAAASEGQGGPGLLGQAWEWVLSLWGDEGMCIDPDGLHCANPAAKAERETTDEGMHIDPNG